MFGPCVLCSVSFRAYSVEKLKMPSTAKFGQIPRQWRVWPRLTPWTAQEVQHREINEWNGGRIEFAYGQAELKVCVRERNIDRVGVAAGAPIPADKIWLKRCILEVKSLEVSK
jgi:hypothetical protein